MVLSRGSAKCERVTVTLLPSVEEGGFRSVPSTFSTVRRTYSWKRTHHVDYMIVPKKVSNTEIQVDLFVNPARKGKSQAKDLQKMVHRLVQGKIETEWHGLKLGGISRPTVASPPNKLFVRGTIEDILGTSLET